MTIRPLGFVILVLSANACGGSPAPQAHAPEAASDPGKAPAQSPESTASEAPEAETTAEIPITCAKGSDPCTPPGAFVNKLCSGSYPGVALYLFAKDTPFVRSYLTRRTEAWNASGGVSETGFVEFDEEVLILRSRKADLGGMQVSGAGGGYDALRWSGTCVTLDANELTRNKPPAAKNAKVEFRFLDDAIKDALRENETVNAAYLARKKECKGATSGDVSLACVKADEALSRAIVSYVRDGGTVPMPTNRP
ncbi:MAG: hypothetical protein SFV15_12170 [Polyangiaceae bacterium]|nr:hypothetical protein [Polyangiaceae bacterium]